MIDVMICFGQKNDLLGPLPALKEAEVIDVIDNKEEDEQLKLFK